MKACPGLDAFGLGLAVKELLAAANWLRGRQANQQQLVADVVLDSQRVPLAQSQVDLLESMAARRLPVVIAIEDLHFMGSDTRELLSELHRRNADVLVLGTAWPESRARPEYNAWREGEGKVTTVYSVQPPSPRDTAAMVLRQDSSEVVGRAGDRVVQVSEEPVLAVNGVDPGGLVSEDRVAHLRDPRRHRWTAVREVECSVM